MALTRQQQKFLGVQRSNLIKATSDGDKWIFDEGSDERFGFGRSGSLARLTKEGELITHEHNEPRSSEGKLKPSISKSQFLQEFKNIKKKTMVG